MKFTIMGFSQEKMIEFKMDLTDALILRWFVDFKDTGKMYSEVIEKDKFYWVNYKDGLLKDIPIINIDKVSIGRRMKKMSENGILKQYIKKEGGTFTMYCLGDKYSLLISSTVRLESSEGCTLKSNGVKLESSEGLNLKVQTKNYSTKETNTLNNNSTKYNKVSKKGQDSFDKLIKEYTSNSALKETIIEYIKMRINKKAKPTNKALELVFKKLDSFASSDQEKIKILEQSILNNWTDIYELKEKKGENNASKINGGNNKGTGETKGKWDEFGF